jgi:hypothetical protein
MVTQLHLAFARLAFPDHMGVISKILMPLYIGELPMVLWLAIMGAKVPKVERAASDVI